MESTDDVRVEKPPSLPPDYVSLAQLQQQWLQRQEEKRLAEEQEKRMAEEQEKRMAEELQQKEKRKPKLPETASRSERRERKENGGERVRRRRLGGTHQKSEELNVGAAAADHPVAGAGGKIKKGKLNKKGARVRGTLIGEEKIGRAEFGDDGLKGEVPIAGTGACRGHALPGINAHEDSGTDPKNGKMEGVFMKGNGRIEGKTDMGSQAFDGKEMVLGDPRAKTRRDSRCEENVVGEGGSVKGNGRRKKKIERGSQAFDGKEVVLGDPRVKTRRDSRCEENVVGEGGSVKGNGRRKKKSERGSQAFGDKEIALGNPSTKTRRELSSEGNVALQGNAELLETKQEGCSVNVGRKRGEERSRNGYQRKWGDAMESDMESRYPENVVEEGLLVGKVGRQKGKTERGSQAFGDKEMVSGNLSAKYRRDSVEESGVANVSVRKGRRGMKDNRRAANGDGDGEVEGGIGVFMLEAVLENKGKEVRLPEGSEEVQIPVAGNGVDQGMLEVVSERRRGGGKVKVSSRRNVDGRGKWGGSRDGKMELGFMEKDGVLTEGNEGQVEKTEMGSQTYGDADVLSGNISTNIGRDFDSLSLDESKEGNVMLRKDQRGWQRKRFGKTRAATGFVWVKKGEISEPSIAEN